MEIFYNLLHLYESHAVTVHTLKCTDIERLTGIPFSTEHIRRMRILIRFFLTWQPQPVQGVRSHLKKALQDLSPIEPVRESGIII